VTQIDPRQLLITSGLRASARRTPGKTALRFEDRIVTYGALAEKMDRIKALAHTRWGLERGAVVGILSPNCIEYIEYISALSEMGIGIATINYRLSAAEVAQISADSGTQIIFYHEECSHLLPPGIPSHKLSDALPEAPPCPQIALDEEDIFAIPYTSGTTGLPKGVMISHRARAMTFYGMAAEYQCFSVDSHFLAIAPLCHGAGFAFGFAPLFFGGTVELMSDFDPERVISALARKEADGVFMVPAHFRQIFNLPPDILERHRGQHRLKAIISNASALPQPLKEQIIDFFGEGLLHETYGSTEGGIVTNLRPADQLRKKNCVGTPFVDTEVSLRDAEGNEVPADTPGELFSRGPALFSGYWRNPNATAESVQNGWVSVGDMATRDDEGYLYIVDRKKDMIISGGINVYPREIENVLVEHPAILECAVFGLKDDQWGESIHCAMVCQSETSAELLAEWLEKRVARFKIPKFFHQIEELPRNGSGKILKRILVEQFSGHLD